MLDKDSLEIVKLEDGRNQITFRKAVLKGKVSQADLLNTILIAARMQSEKLIQKLQRGAILDVGEVKMLKELAEVAKTEIPTTLQTVVQHTPQLEQVKNTLYQALTGRLNPTKVE